MINYKKLRAEIKQQYTQENVAEILSFLGYEINRDYKFKLREGERTASASISNTGQITDFGSGFSGDIVAALFEYKNVPLSTGTLYVAELFNIDLEKFKQ